MKRFLVFAACLVPTLAVAQQAAPDLTLALILTPTDQAQWNAMTIAMDQCVGAAILRRDIAACQALQGYLTDFRGRLASAPAGQAVAPAK